MSRRNRGASHTFNNNLPSINEMINSTKLDSTFAMKEYQVSKFDGKMIDFTPSKKKTDWNQEKGGGFFDFYTKGKAFVPAPNNYKEVERGRGYTVRSHALYKSPRRTDMQSLILYNKKTKPHGPGTYTPRQVQEKVCGSYTSQARVTMAESVEVTANDIPGCNRYKPVDVSQPQ